MIIVEKRRAVLENLLQRVQKNRGRLAAERPRFEVPRETDNAEPDTRMRAPREPAAARAPGPELLDDHHTAAETPLDIAETAQPFGKYDEEVFDSEAEQDRYRDYGTEDVDQEISDIGIPLTPMEEEWFEEEAAAARDSSSLRVDELFDAAEMEPEDLARRPLTAHDFQEPSTEQRIPHPQEPDDLEAMRRAAQEVRVFDPSPLLPSTVADIRGKSAGNWNLEAVLERAFRLGGKKGS